MQAVAEKVLFNVNLRTIEREGKWIAITRETGIVTVGNTEDEALQKAADWNVFWVSEAKGNGYQALKEALDVRDIPFSLESSRVTLELAAVTTTVDVSSLDAEEKSGRVWKLAA